jgi:hypothetical protein
LLLSSSLSFGYCCFCCCCCCHIKVMNVMNPNSFLVTVSTCPNGSRVTLASETSYPGTLALRHEVPNSTASTVVRSDSVLHFG